MPFSIVSVCDFHTLHRIALECPGLGTVANNKKKKLFTNGTACVQCGDAIFPLAIVPFDDEQSIRKRVKENTGLISIGYVSRLFASNDRIDAL